MHQGLWWVQARSHRFGCRVCSQNLPFNAGCCGISSCETRKIIQVHGTLQEDGEKVSCFRGLAGC